MPEPAPGDACFAAPQAMIGVAEATARVRALAAPVVGRTTVPLAEAAGRILAEPLTSPRDVPAFDNVALDGYAFRAADLAEEGRTRLRLLPGRAAAGHPFTGTVPAGHAVKALTGAAMPDGADTVAMWEEAAEADGVVTLHRRYEAGAGRRPAGEDVRRGQRLFAAGTSLLPQHLGVAAELGLVHLPVFEPLRVAILSSGDELQEPGAALPAGGVYDANRYILKALLAPLPVAVTDLGILGDDAAASRSALVEAARGHHLVLASGGASRGEADHVVASVARNGELGFWQIRMKPGRPLAVGRMGAAVFVGLPGNPVAATVCFLLFARPLLMALAGAPWTEPVGYPLPAAFAFERKPGRTELLRARLVQRPDGTPEVHRIAREGSGILTSLTDAQGLVVVPEATSRISPGELVTYLSFAELGLAG